MIILMNTLMNILIMKIMKMAAMTLNPEANCFEADHHADHHSDQE